METKKNINKEHLSRMSNTIFLELFSFVELDNEVDLYQFDYYEKEFLSLISTIPLKKFIKTPHTLRFRKLRRITNNYEGYYNRENRELLIDIRASHSFIHELAHILDFELNIYKSNTTNINKPYSLESDRNFIMLYNRYADYFLTYNQIEDPRYILSPPETWARLFEMYIASKLDLSKLGYLLEELPIVAQECNYPLHLLDDIVNFFDNLLNKKDLRD
ncbi:MAG: hypothetical protein ACQEUT_18345 [Bacillota bacterium]